MLGDYFNKPVSKLPPSLLQFTTGVSFNQQFKSYHPNLVHITNTKQESNYIYTDRYFIKNIPSNITHLTTSWDFNEPLEFLYGITHLITGKKFNQPIYKHPCTLTHLTVGASFNQSTSCHCCCRQHSFMPRSFDTGTLSR